MVSAEKLAMRTNTHQLQSRAVRFAINKQQVGFDMAFPMSLPIAGEGMIALTVVKYCVFGKFGHNHYKIGVEGGAMLAFCLTFVIALKDGGAFNRPHADLP